MSSGIATAYNEEYGHQSKLLKEFLEIPTIAKAWSSFATCYGNGSKAIFEIHQPNLQKNVTRKSILYSHIIKEKRDMVSFEWAPFPVEMTGVSIIVPSPSRSKLLVIRNRNSSINHSSTYFEIWGPYEIEKVHQVSSSVHGSVYTDRWFEGISWNIDETLIAYAAEEAGPTKPLFPDHISYNETEEDNSKNNGFSWFRKQGQWQEDWGEAYCGKGRPSLFVININTGEVRTVQGISRSISVGQVIWAPVCTESSHEYLVFVGWPSSETRNFGIKYCHNRPCALYSTTSPFPKSKAAKEANSCRNGVTNKDESTIVNLTQTISSAYFPRFSLDGKFLVFVSARAAVDSGSHRATNSLHRIDWSTVDGKLFPSTKIIDVISVVMCPKNGSFPGLYCTMIMSNPWLSDGSTLILSTYWRTSKVIISVNLLSGKLSQISPVNSNFYWDVLSLDGDGIIAVCSSPIDVPQIRYGFRTGNSPTSWTWMEVANPISRYSNKVQASLSSRQFKIVKISVNDIFDNVTEGAREPYEAIFVSSKSPEDIFEPLIVVIHGGPHGISSSNFSKNLAFLSFLRYSLLIVNFRGSLGFGEEALQSLSGKVGSQDVKDVLAAIDQIVDMGLAKPSKIGIMGLSYGGFLTTHLIGQAPNKFAAAVAMNPACDLDLMVKTTDVPDWCYAITCGTEGKSIFTEAPSTEHLTLLLNKSPISHVDKVKAPTLFLLGGKDARIPICNGINYARALKEKGGVAKVIVFPEDIHGLTRPQSDFESFLNIGVWFNKYCK